MFGRPRPVPLLACALLAVLLLPEPAPPAQAQWLEELFGTSRPRTRPRQRQRRPVQPAQPVVPVAPPPVSVQPAVPDDRPYDDKLLRLAEILGAIHYLRELCGADEGQLWRDRMQEIVNQEGSTAVRRAKLVQGFNKGYRGYRRTYRSCTKPAKTSIERFLEEGAEISKAMIAESR